jgi:hypothetical protein
LKIIMLWLKRGIILASVLFLALLIFYGGARFYVVYTESQVEGDRAPYFQKQAANGITVCWNTAEAELGIVRYGTRPGNLDRIAKDAVPAEAHEIRLNDLQPGTRYYYTVGNTAAIKYGGSGADWFTTAPETGTTESVRLWVIGDSGNPGPVAQSVRDAMKLWIAENPREGKDDLDQWLLLGDNAYRSGSNQQHQAALFDAYPNLLRNLAFWPVYGNHDARRWTFFDIFSLPENAESGGIGSGTENYYSFDYANIHFVMLDSQDSDREPDSDMLVWLRRDLEANQQDWLIAAFHHPPYSKGSHDSDDEEDSDGRLVDMRVHVLPVLEQYGVDLVLSGHSHVYERSHLIDCHYGDSSEFNEKHVVSHGTEGDHQHYIKSGGGVAHSGAVYVVAGASSNVDNAEINHPAMAFAMLETGALVIDIEDNVLTSRYINSEGMVIDEFVIEKKDGVQNDYVGCAD